MKYKARNIILLFSFLLLTPLFATATVTTPGNIHIDTQPHYTTTISPNFYTTTTSTINAVGMQVRDIGLHIMEKAQQTFTQDNYNSTKNLLQQLLWQYRYNIATIACIGAYSTTSLLLLSDHYYLTDATRWAHWKSDYNFERLCNISHHELEQELIRAIGEHHVNKKNPTDLSHPLILFIEAIEHEIKICKRYMNIAHTIQGLHLGTIFPTNNNKVAEINRCLKRALFIKHIFLSWLTERNLTTKSIKKMSVPWQL